MGVLVILLGLFPAGQDVEFTRKVMKKKKVSLGDVCLVFYSLLDEKKPAKTAEQAADVLIKKGWFPKSWKKDLATNASLGEVSYLVCAALRIRGGLTMRITGYTTRYCYKECVFRRLVERKGPHSAVKGRDLLGIATQVENKLEAKRK